LFGWRFDRADTALRLSRLSLIPPPEPKKPAVPKAKIPPYTNGSGDGETSRGR